ncbi:MAG: hypothetical protein O4861_06700, partial [Trichodesmium sp. St16_bin4-tuft]|nr:hypothetical protein [Trichodesmium sp. St5_bin8]MDE5077218.1 hypothetical protein [Trichodesmium sp. St2_bin6]MDE5098036.1 hypothetical protein [Trichodesmium sp. St16_bin4-tuft]
GDRLEQGWLVHSRKNNTAAQRAGLAIAPWSWNDHYTYPTLCALHYPKKSDRLPNHSYTLYLEA